MDDAAAVNNNTWVEAAHVNDVNVDTDLRLPDGTAAEEETAFEEYKMLQQALAEKKKKVEEIKEMIKSLEQNLQQKTTEIDEKLKKDLAEIEERKKILEEKIESREQVKNMLIVHVTYWFEGLLEVRNRAKAEYLANNN